MEIFGVVNASPDSLADFSVASTAQEADAYARQLLLAGADHIDLGGQASHGNAAFVTPEQEWEILEGPLRAITALGVTVSVDTWQVETAEKAFDAGASVLNAADALQNEAMLEFAARRECDVVLPFKQAVERRLGILAARVAAVARADGQGGRLVAGVGDLAAPVGIERVGRPLVAPGERRAARAARRPFPFELRGDVHPGPLGEALGVKGDEVKPEDVARADKLPPEQRARVDAAPKTPKPQTFEIDELIKIKLNRVRRFKLRF